MRVINGILFSILLCLSALGSQARAAVTGAITDCDQQHDRSLVARGCDELIHQGRLDYPAYINRGNTYRANGDLDSAIADFSEAIRIGPDLPQGYNNRGLTYAVAGKYDEAIADFSKSLEINPEDAITLNMRGLAYISRGKYDLAIIDLDAAIKRDPKHVDAYNNRAWAYFQSGKASKGLPDAEMAVTLRRDAPALDTRGHIYEALGRKDDAIADYRDALSLDPHQDGSAEALQRLGADLIPK